MSNQIDQIVEKLDQQNIAALMNRARAALERLSKGEKLLAHCCPDCHYPCGFVMRGNKLYFDRNCWCTPDIHRVMGAAVQPATLEQIAEEMRPKYPAFSYLELYCEDQEYTPQSWGEYIGAVKKKGEI